MTGSRADHAIDFANDLLRQGIGNVHPDELTRAIFDLRDCLIAGSVTSPAEDDMSALEALRAEIKHAMDFLDGPGGQWLWPGKPTREQYTRHAAALIYWHGNFRRRNAAVAEVVEFIETSDWRQAASIHDHTPLPEPSVAAIIMRIRDHFRMMED